MADATTVGCRFAKRGCTHGEQLFKRAYQRVNRARGTKILRCFPHCCPRHIERSYCGSTLELRVDAAPAAGGAALPFAPSELAVYARFRPEESDADVRVGDIVALATITQALQSSSNTKVPWIPSRLSHDTRGGTKKDTGACAFEINPSRRWYYTWYSSKNSAKRATKHVLEAFVFLRLARGDALRCVGAVVSPGFTLVSFRRVSAEETASVGSAAAAAGTKIAAMPRTPVMASLGSLFEDEDGHSEVGSDASGASEAKPEPYGTSPFSRCLDLLFRVAEQRSVGDAKRLIPHWSSHLTGTMPHGHGQGRRTLLSLADEEDVAVHLVWWLMLDREVHDAWIYYTRRGAFALLNIAALQASFDEWMGWLANHTERFLASLGLAPLSRLTASLSQRVPPENGSTCHGFGWRTFVAQARDTFIRRTIPVSASLPLSRPWICALTHVTFAQLNPNSRGAQIQPNTAHHEAPVATLLAFMQQLCCVRIDLDTRCSPHTLTVASPRSPADIEWPGTKLLLDNRYRWFNALPHGEPTLAMAHPLARYFGDYIASYRRDGTIEVACFSWVRPANDAWVAFKWLWKFHCDSLEAWRLNVFLTLSVSDLQLPPTSGGDYPLECCSIQEKLAMVKAWREEYQVQLPYAR